MADLSMTPDLRELLGAIADDPRAQLLSVRSHQAAREGLERNPKVSSSAPFLRKAERRLLELHREELGRLLYAYAHVVRMQVPGNRTSVHYTDCKVAPLAKAEIDHRARALLKTRGAEEPEADLLRRCLKATSGIRPTEIIGAMLRAAPSGKAQLMVGADLVSEGRPAEANKVLRSFLGMEVRSSLDSYAWEGLGHLAVEADTFEEAAACYESAVRADPERVVPALAWLRFCLLAESKEGAVHAAAFIDHHVTGDAPGLAWYFHLGESGLGPMSSSPQRELARQVASQCGPISRSLIDAFH